MSFGGNVEPGDDGVVFDVDDGSLSGDNNAGITADHGGVSDQRAGSTFASLMFSLLKFLCHSMQICDF